MSERPEALIVPTGVANLASVRAGLTRAGAAPRIERDPEVIAAGELVVLPGVGAFAAGMAELRETGLDRVLAERVQAGRPLLAVCLGMQLLCEESEESPGVAGLGIVPGKAVHFPPEVRAPQFGWNRVTPSASCGWLREGYAYFANSFCLRDAPPGWSVATAEHGGTFVAAMERDRVLTCQFHPELSGAYGMDLLERWVVGGNMLTARVIPCLDVRDGRVVKGVRFQGLRDAGSPPELAAAYEAQGADELVMLDVSASPEGRRTAHETVRALREQLSIPLTVGGGVRVADDAARLLDDGADKVSTNTAAVKNPVMLTEMATRFGRQCTVLAMDAAWNADSGMFEVIILSGTDRTGINAVDWAREATDRGAGEILLTSWDRDGTRSGYDLEMLRAVSSAVQVPVIASGGANTPQHLIDALRAGADAVLAASIFHDGDMTVADVKREMAAAGVEVRQ